MGDLDSLQLPKFVGNLATCDNQQGNLLQYVLQMTIQHTYEFSEISAFLGPLGSQAFPFLFLRCGSSRRCLMVVFVLTKLSLGQLLKVLQGL